MAHLTWADATAVNPTNLNKLTQEDDLKPPNAVAFNGASGRTITHNCNHRDYQVIINPVEDPGGNLGEVWYSKIENSVTIYNSGSATTLFHYLIIPHA